MDYEQCRDIYATGGMNPLLAALDGTAPHERTEAALIAARAVGDVAAQNLARFRAEAEERQVGMAYWQIVMPLNAGRGPRE
ncbi:hypothetical protein [Streptomyces anulatus]|uniref:hypothetical protein n=1 Tax=Streptomyces anulatus TaxID=1892 RepID=UPI0037DC2BAD|nr:hypothetical protein OHB50_39495 [Streptomyces anulatus]